jgi:predicted nucleic acid-binding protein
VTTLVDSNVLLDVITEDDKWLDWSIEALDRRAAEGKLYISDVVYAELAVKKDSEAVLDEALAILRVTLSPMPKSALFLAGKVFGRYRRAGGPRTSNLPDFFIGAHAQVAGLPILTRDVQRYRRYFPKVELIAPDA